MPILLVVGQEDFLRMPREFVRGAVQRIVERLSHFEEVVATGDDVPMGGHLQFSEQRHQAVQHLGDSSADGSGIDHL